MTPATATIAFAHNGTDTIIRPSFIEFLWRQRSDGEVSWHFETDTKRTGVGDGTFVGPGVFKKGSATGILYIDFGQNLTPTARKFWWPAGSASKQPPIKHGQNLFAKIGRFQGMAANVFTAGYTGPLSAFVLSLAGGVQRIYFEISGPGKPTIPLQAQHFITSGDLRIYADGSYLLTP